MKTKVIQKKIIKKLLSNPEMLKIRGGTKGRTIDPD